MTFAALITQTKKFLNRDDLTDAEVGDFIALAEGYFNRNLRVREMVDRVTAPLDEEYEYVPQDFLEARRIYISNTSPRHELRAMSPQSLVREYPGTGTGRPRAYAILSSQIQFAPPPDSSSTYVMELSYFAKLAPLTSLNQTNSVLDNYADLYLWATCREASVFLLDDNGIARFTGLRDTLLAQCNIATEQHQYASGPLRISHGMKAVEGRFR